MDNLQCKFLCFAFMLILFLVSCKTRTISPPVSGSINFGDLKLNVTGAFLDASFPARCTSQSPNCSLAKPGYQYLSLDFTPLDLPQGQALPYKSVPNDTSVQDNLGSVAIKSLYQYDNASRVLKLGFEVPKNAVSFTLLWPGNTPLPLVLTK